MNIRLCVQCTYEVTIDCDNVPEEIAEKLLMREVVDAESEVEEWLCDTIQESDATDWQYDIVFAKEIKDEL